MKADYESWLRANFEAATVTTQMSQARRLEKAYGDLDDHFDRDQFANILADLRYTTADRAAGKPSPTERVKIDGENLYGGLSHLRGALRYYGRFRSAGEAVEWPALELMRQRFLKLCPDFITFDQEAGTYFDTERSYKDTLIDRVRSIMSGTVTTAQDIGLQLLDVLAVKPSNFVGWRAFDQMEQGGDEVKTAVAVALGELVSSPEAVTEAAATAAAKLQPVFRQGASGKPAYSQVRTLVTAALALARPSDAICVKTRFMRKAAKALTGDPIFKPAMLDAEEYGAFLKLAERIRQAMTNWGWRPQDLWDVQGFLWVVTNDTWKPDAGGASNALEDDGDDEPMNDKARQPLNQILFGPPGTGKTWATARLAVDICNGEAPADRTELMNVYNELVKARRVAFTTFHQSIGYEEFVEGLRPVTDSEEGDDRASAGFHLEARNGIFRDICALAEQARKRTGRPGHYDFNGRQFFKMSLGRARTESHIYDAAIDGSYISLGWGGEVDWSDRKYIDYKTVLDRWREKEPDASGNSGNIVQVWQFRGNMKVGDIVIISDGNIRYRAIAEITGDYQYKPQDVGYPHRRSVRWLAVLEDSLPATTIYDGQFSQASCYRLDPKRIKPEALAEQIRSEPTDSSDPPESFVLIVDEINRANVSKVLGELITLLEPDKRLGAPNALTVKLPYSLDEFGVPNNLYVIGTMNTADRSIALLDTALRRRFQFTEMMPDYDCLDREIDGIHLGRLLSGINRRVEWLFDRDHQIGHSFFTSVESKDALDETMQSKIIPLLTEYFYDDWEKVRIALNDTGHWFIDVEKLPAPRMMQEEGQERSRYSIKGGEIPVEAYTAAASEAE
jgi:5-methylcytosine-specific restriction enzyme B